MHLFDVVNLDLLSQVPQGVCDAEHLDLLCPATALNATTAALATIGYWVQADILHFLNFTSFGLLAPMAYMFGAIAGLIGVATGQTPRNYLWLFIGPALFAWLIDTPTKPVTGVKWQIGMSAMDPDHNDDRSRGEWRSEQDQREVWKAAEAGLANTNIAQRLHAEVHSDGPPTIIDPTEGPDGPRSGVRVATVFLWLDELMSSIVNWMVEWTGVLNASAGNPGVGNFLSNLPVVGGLLFENTPGDVRTKWYLISNTKWEIVEDITSAKLSSPDLRDAFATFIASECGQKLFEHVDDGAFAAASSGSPGSLPNTIFTRTPPRRIHLPFVGDIGTPELSLPWNPNNYNALKADLRSMVIPKPSGLNSLLKGSMDKAVQGSFIGALDWSEYAPGGWGPSLPGADHSGLANLQSGEAIGCDEYLNVLISAFRWEAGHIYWGIIHDIPDLNGNGVKDDEFDLSYVLFYGWDLKQCMEIGVGDLSGCVKLGPLASLFQTSNFLKDLILIHLFRNEMAILPQPRDVRYSGSRTTRNYVEAYQRAVGSKAKFGEIYVWARLMPYFQGMLLYFLAVGYPFACIMIVVPGMHRTIITWITFWCWAKLWDLGFAIVMALERTVWASVGSGSKFSQIFPKIIDMQFFGLTGVRPSDDCLKTSLLGSLLDRADFLHGVVDLSARSGPKCAVADVALFNLNLPGLVGALTPSSLPIPGMAGLDPAKFGDALFNNNLKILDRSMTLAASMDLDLTNSFYIYIMSALYFAVPPVMGQLVLGAKAGAASLVTGALGGLAQEAGRAGGSGYTGDISQRLKSDAASVGQASWAASMRKGGFAGQAMAAQNKGLELDNMGSYASALSQGYGYQTDNMSLARQQKEGRAGAEGAVVNAGVFTGRTIANLGGDKKTKSSSSPIGMTSGAAGDIARPDPTETIGNQGIGDSRYQDGGRGGGAENPSNNLNTQSGTSTPPTTGGGGTRGAGPSGQSGRVGPGKMPNLNEVINTVGSQAEVWNKAATGAYSSKLGTEQFAFNAGVNAAKADLGVAGFGYGGASRGYSTYGQRMAAQGRFQADSDRWTAVNRMANQVGASAAAQGVFAATIDPGMKPQDMDGSAMSGLLNSQANGNLAQEGTFTNPNGGGYFSLVGSNQAKLDQRTGGAVTGAAYKPIGGPGLPALGDAYGALNGGESELFGPAPGPVSIDTGIPK